MSREDKAEYYLNDTVKLMRKYIEQKRPQSFASCYSIFASCLAECEALGIKTEDYTDLYEYAKKEKIERFGF